MSANTKKLLSISLGVILLIFGCAALPPKPDTSSREPEPRAEIPSTTPGPESTESIKEPAPRTLASLRLTEQARLLIVSDRPDEAIRTLEKALNIDPGNGQNYYFLAEAWMKKGNRREADEFNRMAAIYLDHDAGWMLKVREQKERIAEMRR